MAAATEKEGPPSRGTGTPAGGAGTGDPEAANRLKDGVLLGCLPQVHILPFQAMKDRTLYTPSDLCLGGFSMNWPRETTARTLTVTAQARISRNRGRNVCVCDFAFPEPTDNPGSQ